MYYNNCPLCNNSLFKGNAGYFCPTSIKQKNGLIYHYSIVNNYSNGIHKEWFYIPPYKIRRSKNSSILYKEGFPFLSRQEFSFVLDCKSFNSIEKIERLLLLS